MLRRWSQQTCSDDAAHDTKEAGNKADTGKQSVRPAVDRAIHFDANPVEQEHRGDDDGDQSAGSKNQTDDALRVHV